MAKRTPLYEAHAALGARVIDFNGWDMPVQYPAGIIAEHLAVREKAGVFDTCHMGEFFLTSHDVRKTLNQLLTGDFAQLKEGRMRYTFLTAGDGTVVDDAVVFLISAREALICVNAGDIPGDFAFLNAALPAGAQLEDQSEATGKLDIQGPLCWQVVERLLGIDFRAMPFYSFVETEWSGTDVILSRSGYTGSPGVEVFLAAEAVEALWKAVLAEGQAEGLMPCGLGARDTLRLEAGLPLYGHELNRGLNPLQAGFGRFVSLEKPEDFPGKSALKQIASAVIPEVLAGLEILDRRVARQGFPVLWCGKSAGVVTSGGPAPSAGGNVALAYLAADCSEPGTEVEVDIRGKSVPARVVALPFYKCDSLRKIERKQG